MFLATVIAVVLLALVYWHSGWRNIGQCYGMWFTKEYWINYNVIEAISWLTKAIIIVPGLIFGVQIWWLYFLTLITSLALIWASHKKLLPTLVAFNSLWTWMSCVVLIKSLV